MLIEGAKIRFFHHFLSIPYFCCWLLLCSVFLWIERSLTFYNAHRWYYITEKYNQIYTDECIFFVVCMAGGRFINCQIENITRECGTEQEKKNKRNQRQRIGDAKSHCSIPKSTHRDREKMKNKPQLKWIFRRRRRRKKKYNDSIRAWWKIDE